MQENASIRQPTATLSQHPWLDIAWVFYGSALMIFLQLLVMLLAGWTFLGRALEEANTVNDQFVVLGEVGAALLFCYFLGGLLVGRMSSGKTILEPAISAVLPIGLLMGYVLTRRSSELGQSALFGWLLAAAGVLVLFCFLIAMLGGYLGEKWQSAAQKTM